MTHFITNGALDSQKYLNDPNFWLRDLRLGKYNEITTQIHNPAYRLQRIASLFRTRRVLEYVAEKLGVPSQGTIEQLQNTLAEAESALLPYFLVAAFAPHKTPAAVVDAAEAALSKDALNTCRDSQGRYDRLLLLLHLLDTHPGSLAHVRGLHVWHRQGAASLVLAGRPRRKSERFIPFLTAENVENAIADVPRPPGVPAVRFEMAIPRPGGDVLLLLRRNLRRAHHWSDDGTRIAHGHDEEMIVLHFLNEGRRVKVSALTSEFPRRLAEAIASAWFEQSCHFVDDLSPAEPACLQRLIAALLSRQVNDLRLVELAVKNSPLEGAPELVIRAPEGDCDIAKAIIHFENTTGPLLDRLDDVMYMKVQFGDRRIVIDFPIVGGQPIARFADGRLDRHAAEAFREFVEHQFGLQLHSMELRCA